MKITRLSLWLILILFSLGFISQTFALPFSIVTKAGTTLPTIIFPGQTLTAYYTVTNNSGITLTGNFVKYLPTNVNQSTSPDAIATDPCGFTFTLTPFGSGPTSSCTLKLLITGGVSSCNSGNCDPHECLFICTSGGATCAGTPNPLNVTQLPPPTFVTVGVYDLEGSLHRGTHLRPGILSDGRKMLAKNSYLRRQTLSKNLAYRSTDLGLSWINVFVPFIDLVDQELNGVTCFGVNCVAVGVHSNVATRGGVATAFTSNDQGASWTPSLSLPSSGIITSVLHSVACHGNLCAAVGGDDAAIAFFSTDYGLHWTNNNPVESGTSTTVLQSISCPTNSCAVVGYAEVAPFGNEAVTYTTNNVGQTFSAVNVLPRVQPSFVSELYDVSCISSGHCVAVGRFIDSVTAETQPLVYTSGNFGATWSNAILPTKPAIAALAFLYGVSCVSNHCVAVGFYEDISDLMEKPLSYISSDGGNTWTLSATLPPVSHFNANLFKVSCVSTGLCNAVGAYINGSVFQPITYRSVDFGDTWTVVFPPYQGTTNSFLFDVAA